MQASSEYAQLRARRLQRTKEKQEEREQADAAKRGDFKRVHRTIKDEQTWQQRAVVAEGECARLRGELEKLRELDTSMEDSKMKQLEEALEEERQTSETVADALRKAQEQNKAVRNELQALRHELEDAESNIVQLEQQEQSSAAVQEALHRSRLCASRRFFDGAR